MYEIQSEPPASTTRGQNSMHNHPCGTSSHGAPLRGGWWVALLSMALLSFGVGATTAAFTLLDGTSHHSAPLYGCETVMQLSGGSSPSSFMHATMPTSVKLEDRLSDAYGTSHDAAEAATGAWSDVTDNPDVWPFAPLFAAGAIGLLVGCTRAAAWLAPAPRATTLVAGSAIGSLVVAAMLIEVLGLPLLGMRAVAFTACVSLLAAKASARCESWVRPPAPAR